MTSKRYYADATGITTEIYHKCPFNSSCPFSKIRDRNPGQQRQQNYIREPGIRREEVVVVVSTPFATILLQSLW